jgi:hypothetical protein
MSNPGPSTTVTIHPSNLATNQAIRLLAFAKQVPLTATGDAAVMPIINSSSYSVSNVVATNASASISTAYLGVFPQPAAQGTAIVSNAVQTVAVNAVVQETINTTALQTTQNLYVNVGTAQSGTAVDIYVYGYDFTQY